MLTCSKLREIEKAHLNSVETVKRIEDQKNNRPCSAIYGYSLGGVLVSFLTSLLKFKPPSSDASIGCKAIPVEWSAPFSLPFLFLSSSRPDSLSSHPSFWFPLELTCDALFIAQPASALSIASKSAQSVALPASRTLSTPQKAKAYVLSRSLWRA
jgi:hypothetical protein